MLLNMRLQATYAATQEVFPLVPERIKTNIMELTGKPEGSKQGKALVFSENQAVILTFTSCENDHLIRTISTLHDR